MNSLMVLTTIWTRPQECKTSTLHSVPIILTVKEALETSSRDLSTAITHKESTIKLVLVAETMKASVRIARRRISLAEVVETEIRYTTVAV